MRVQVLSWAIIASVGGACQDYPFETRPPKRVQAKKITELVASIVPTDILFLIDNSGSMQNHVIELQNNIDIFVDELAKSDNDFQAAIVTPDVECNVPRYKCINDCLGYLSDTICNSHEGCAWAGGTCTLTWRLGSYTCCTPAQRPACRDVADGNGGVISSNCDGGRLRTYSHCSCPQYTDESTCVANTCSWQLGTRIFKRPAPEDQVSWAAEFKATIASLGTDGSSYEGGLEAVARAVSCSAGVDCDDPLDKPVKDLNAGFIRPEADLVVILLTDEDDCSLGDRNAYAQPTVKTDPTEQASHLCWPDECYAYYGVGLDENTNGLMDWADPLTTSASAGLLQCGPSGSKVPRVVNPPLPRAVDDFLDRLALAKGGDITRVRAAGIIGSVSAASAALGSESAACVDSSMGPSNNCGCVANTGDPFLCVFTGAIGQQSICSPGVPDMSHGGVCTTSTDGCMALPGGRYLDLLEKVSARRVSALARSDTLVDSICKAKYDQTMYDIVNNIILNNCFTLGQAPGRAEDLNVTLNGDKLDNVPEKSADPGWSWRACSQQICLEGGLRKAIGDDFQILLLQDGCQYLTTKADCENPKNCCNWVDGICQKKT